MKFADYRMDLISSIFSYSEPIYFSGTPGRSRRRVSFDDVSSYRIAFAAGFRSEDQTTELVVVEVSFDIVFVVVLVDLAPSPRCRGISRGCLFVLIPVKSFAATLSAAWNRLIAFRSKRVNIS